MLVPKTHVIGRFRKGCFLNNDGSNEMFAIGLVNDDVRMFMSKTMTN